MFLKIDVLEIIANYTGKHLCWSLFLNKVTGLKATGCRPETQVFSCEIYKIFKNDFFYRTPLVVTFTYCLALIHFNRVLYSIQKPVI